VLAGGRRAGQAELEVGRSGQFSGRERTVIERTFPNKGRSDASGFWLWAVKSLAEAIE